MGPYPATLAPRDKKPSHSSSEETSSEFDLLEIKITRKKNIKEKQSKCSIEIFLTTILLSLDYKYQIYPYFLYIGSKIFSKKYPNNIFSLYKEKIEIYTKYLEKKSN